MSRSKYYYSKDHGHCIEMYTDGSVYHLWMDAGWAGEPTWMGEHIIHPQSGVSEFDFTKYF